jgi:hypothetical protein
MGSVKSSQFPALWLLMSVGEQYRFVDTVIGAADILINAWPPAGGIAYLRALEACQHALCANGPVDAVPAALMHAADEAFICYIRVIDGAGCPDLAKGSVRQHHVLKVASSADLHPGPAGCARLHQ